MLLAPIFTRARKKFLEQQPEQLQRDVLERQGGPVKQFEQPLLFVELPERGDRSMGETAISGPGEFAQAFGAQAAFDKRQHDPRGELGIRQSRHGSDFGGGELRPGARHIEAAVAGEPGQRRPGEIERRSAAACRDIFHGGRG